MTRKQAVKLEKILRDLGVHKPYVTGGRERTDVESYPLTAIITDGGVHRDLGPFQVLEISDCSLSRIGRPSDVCMARIYLGQDALGILAQLLTAIHPEAYARAKEQDAAAVARCA